VRSWTARAASWLGPRRRSSCCRHPARSEAGGSPFGQRVRERRSRRIHPAASRGGALREWA
jgi:hypothetical protein